MRFLQILTTMSQYSFVGDCLKSVDYGHGMDNLPNSVEHNAAWLRSQRSQMGWSTTDVANKARAQAKLYGDTIKLSQQLISKFENGGLKSTPRWLGYVQAAIARECDGDLTEGFHALILSRDLSAFFARKAIDLQDRETQEFDEFAFSMTDEEVQLVTLLRALSFEDRQTVVLLAERLAGLSGRTLHDSSHHYKPHTNYTQLRPALAPPEQDRTQENG